MARLCAAGLTAVILMSASPQVVTEMTPEQIRQAIAVGSTGLLTYEIRVPGVIASDARPLGSFTTPFLRVAIAAFEAKRAYRSFTESDVTRQMIVGELRVFVGPWSEGGRATNAKAIVIAPKGDHDPSSVIHPISLTVDDHGLAASFPLTSLRDGNEVHIIYAGPVHIPGLNSCDDCAVEFKLDRVR